MFLISLAKRVFSGYKKVGVERWAKNFSGRGYLVVTNCIV